MSPIDLNTCPLLTTKDLQTLLRMPTIADKAIRKGWIKPIQSTGRNYLFKRADVDRLVARIAAGEMP